MWSPYRRVSAGALVLVAAVGAGCNGVARQAKLDGPERRLALHVKFSDSLPIAANAAGELVPAPDEPGRPVPRDSRDAGTLKQLQVVARRHALVFAPAIQAPDTMLADLRARAQAESGEAQPDLRRLFVARAPEADAAGLEQAARDLRENPGVDYADVVEEGIPPPGDIPPATSFLVDHQYYRGPDPGINADVALKGGFTGAGVRLSDCEYGWNGAHEDLNDLDLHPEPHQTVAPAVMQWGWNVHGTAVLGITSAGNNAYGCTGIAPGADVYTYPELSEEEGDRRLTAITKACAGSAKGDIVLLEMQTTKHWGSQEYGPAELDAAVFQLTRLATAAGIVVVAAAGNGRQDLDSAEYAFYRAYGEEPGGGDTDEVQSGAILVGAGTPDTGHHRYWSSTYGRRIDLQGWGAAVFTLGYGSYDPTVLDVNQRYTLGFGGTSAAAAMVAGACAVLQEAAADLRGARLSPRDLRDLLVTTGTPAGASSGLGPLPDLKKAIEALAPSQP